MAQLITYDSKFQAAFVALNRQWIETHFKLEPMDLMQLENPAKLILETGGEIFFVLDGGEAVGTCAMLAHGPACYELAKMAVSPQVRGKGFGDLLMKASIKWAEERKAEKIMLLSNTILTPAIQLYRKHGFQTVTLGAHPDYERCNIIMEKLL